MKAGCLAIMIGVALAGCTTSDPITYYEAHPPDEVGKYHAVDLPPTASPEEVTRAAFEPTVGLKVLEVRQVRSKGANPHTAVLINLKGYERRIVALKYVGKDRGGWMLNAFNASRIPNESRADRKY